MNKLKTSRDLVVTILVCMVCMLTYGYLLRNTFTTYDVVYFDDLFDHSQYSIAESYRTIGDGDLYAITGWRLLRSGNPFADVPQAPPVGKYVFGFAIQLLGNPYIANYIFLVFVLAISASITYVMTKSKRAVMYCTLLLITNTQLIQQMNRTMLDIIQATWLLGHIYFLIVWKKYSPQSLIIVGLSGFFLGLFAATKFGIFTPFIFVTSFIYVLRRPNILAISTLLTGALIGFCLPYTPYIVSHGPIQFLKSQKWVFLFWLAGNNSKAFYGMPIITYLTGMYKHFNPGTSWEWDRDWSPVWSIIGLTYIREIVAKIKKVLKSSFLNVAKNSMVSWLYLSEYKYLVVLTALFLLIYSMLPFYSRYLLPISILMIIIWVSKSWSSFRPIYFTVLIIICFGLTVFRLLSTPAELLNTMVNQVNLGLYKDLCRSIQPATLHGETCDEFQQRIHKLIYQLGASKVTMSVGSVPGVIFDTNVNIPFTIIYATPIGSLTNDGELRLVRRGNGYKLVWSDEYLLAGYTKETKVLGNFINGKKGVLRDKGIVIAEDVDRPYFVVYPDQIISENHVNQYIGKHMDEGDFYAQLKYKVNHTPELPADVGFVKILPLTYPVPAGIAIEQRRIAGDQNQHADYRSEIGGEIVMKRNGFPDKILLRKNVRDGRVIDL